MDFDPGEQVLFLGHPSWRSQCGLHLTGALLALAAGVAAGVATRIAEGGVALGWVVVAVVAGLGTGAAIGRLRRLATTYAITDRRLVIERGILARDLHQTRLERIQSVTARRSLRQRLLGIGDVDFDTAAEAGFRFAFDGVERPRQIVRTVDRALHELRPISSRV